MTHPNRELCIDISKKTRRTVAHPNSELCIVISKQARLNRSQSEQGTLHCYIEKDKTEPFPILTANSALLHQKGRDWIGPHVNIENGEDWTVLPADIELCIGISKKIRLNRAPSQRRTLLYCNRLDSALLQRKNTRRIVAFPNRELCIDISRKAKLNYCPFRTESSAMFDRKR